MMTEAVFLVHSAEPALLDQPDHGFSQQESQKEVKGLLGKATRKRMQGGLIAENS